MSESLVLEISDFEHRGSEGSGTFGKPNDILGKRGINETLGKLRSLLSGEQVDYLANVEPSSVRSLAVGYHDRQCPVHITQADFSTQVYQPPQKASGIRSLDILKPPAVASGLLTLLRNVTRPPIVSSESGNTAPSHQSVPASLSRGNVLGATGTLQAKANIQPQLFQPARVSGRSDPNNPPSVETGLVNGHSARDTDSEKENGEEGGKVEIQLPQPFKLQPTAQVTAVEHDLQVAIPAFYDQFQESTPFEGMKRVPRRYTRIPTAQQSILERDDAWFEPQETGRPRYANLPTQVQTDLTEFIVGRSKHMSSNIDSRESDSDSSSEDDDNDVEMSSEDDLTDTKTPREVCHNGSLRERKSSHNMVDGQQQSRLATSQSQEGKSHVDSDVEPGDEDDGVSSWSLSDRHNVERNTVVPTMLCHSSTSGPRKHASPTATSLKVLRSVSQHLSRDEIARPLFRARTIPEFPASSPTNEDDLELGIPFAVGDQEQEHDHDERDVEELSISMHFPSTGPQSSRSVQVERTPIQKFTGRSQHSLETESPKQPVKQLKHPSPDVFSDAVIPATFPWGSHHRLPSAPMANATGMGYSHTKLDDDTSDEEEDFFADALDEQQKDEVQQEGVSPQCTELERPLQSPGMTQPHPPRHMTPSLSRPRESLSVTPTTAMTARAPSPILGLSSPALQSSVYGLDDMIQVPTTQASPVDPLKPEFSNGRPDSTVAKTSRFMMASLVERNESPRRDTREMARLSRHKFNRSFNDDLASAKHNFAAQRHTRSSPIPNPAIQKNIIDVDNTAPRLLDSFVTVAIKETPAPKERTPESSEECGWGQQLPRGVTLAAELQINLPERSGLGESSLRDGNVEPKQAANLENDTTLAGATATSSPEKSAPFGLLFTETVAHSAANGMVSTKHVDFAPTAQFSYYDEFQSTYPEFNGSERRFTEALIYIEWLRKNNQTLHTFLSDDFVRVYCMEYIAWALQQRREGKPLITGWEYYHENVPKPAFQCGIITHQNLTRALASLDKTYVEKVRNIFYQNMLKSQKSSPPVETIISELSLQAQNSKCPFIESSQPVDVASTIQHYPVSTARTTDATEEEVVNFEDLENSLSMRSSHFRVRPDLQSHSMIDPSSTGRESGRNSRTASAERENATARHPSSAANPSVRAAPTARKLFFETPSQLHNQRERPQSVHVSSPTGLAQLHGQESEQSSGHKIARRSFPWETATIHSPHVVAGVTTSLYLNNSLSSSNKSRPAPREYMNNEQPSASQKVVGEASLRSEDDQLTTSRKPPKASRKRHREASPILGSWPEPEVSAPPSKQRKIASSRSATSSIRQRNSSRVPSSPGSRISSREITALPEVDGAARLGGWLEGLQQGMPPQEERRPQPNLKAGELRRSEPKKRDAKKAAPLSFRERVQGFLRKKDRVSLGTASKRSSPNSAPVRVSSAASGSTIVRDVRGKGKAKAIEPETQGWEY